MPVTRCRTDGRPGFRWGGAGTCYPYIPGNTASRDRARAKAVAQGAAIAMRRRTLAIRLRASLLEAGPGKRRSQQKSKERSVRPIMLAMKKQLGVAFRQHMRSFMADFERLRPLFPTVSEVVTATDITPILTRAGEASQEAFVLAYETEVARALFAAFGNLLGDVGEVALLGAVEGNPLVTAYLAKFAAKRVVGINATTEKDLRAIITQSAREGWAWTRTAREIRKQYEMFGGPPLRPSLRELRTRAELIAVTEIGDAYEEGTRITASTLADRGLPMEKFWLTVGDDRVSDDDKANQAQGWIPFGEAFQSGHQRPTSHPGCRCTNLYRVRRQRAARPPS